MFNLEQFIDDCLAARRDGDGQRAVREVLSRAMSAPNDVLTTLGEPSEAGAHKLYQSEELTILNVVWAPLMTILPHNHEMWASIGIYTGREDNIFWRRVDGKIEAASAISICVGDVETLGKDIIHTVTNPIERLTGAIQIYGGDFFEVERSEWEPESLTERPYDMEKNMRLFQEANARFTAHAAIK